MALIAVRLRDLLDEIKEDGFYHLISDFYYEKNKDVTFLLRHKSVPFERIY